MEDKDMLAKAGIGAYLTVLADGTLGSVDPENIYQMADAMATNPKAVAKALGNDERLGQVLSPDQFRTNILESYYDAMFAADIGEAQMELEDNRQSMLNHRHDTAYSYSHLTPEEIGRLEYDRDNGDMSAHLAVQEKFYLG